MRRTLLTASFFRVDEVTVPDGQGGERKRQIVVHPGATVILPRLDSERIILIRNVREAVDRELLELPAGKLDANEDAEACARRELEEETGYRCGHITRLCEFFPSPGILTEKLYAFVAEDLTEVGQRLEAGEQIAPVIMTLDEAMDMVREHRIEDGKTLITLMMFDLLGRRC